MVAKFLPAQDCDFYWSVNLSRLAIVALPYRLVRRLGRFSLC